MIEVKSVKKAFSRDKHQIEALKEVTLKVEESEVIVNRKDLSKLNSKKSREVRKKIGMIFQHFKLLESKTKFKHYQQEFFKRTTSL